ncbi:unnamed protein product [Boreogadus saida]
MNHFTVQLPQQQQQQKKPPLPSPPHRLHRLTTRTQCCRIFTNSFSLYAKAGQDPANKTVCKLRKTKNS